MTKVILIGTGTPNPDPYRMGPCVLIQYEHQVLLFDAGAGLVRRINEIAKSNHFSMKDLKHCFITHLHSDHTLGLADLMITPWILGRNEALNFYGPKGLANMVDHIKKAYQIDFHERIHGLEKANETGCTFLVNEIQPGIIYDNVVTVEAFLVNHGNFEAYGYKITTPDKTIVISGDTAPCKTLISKAKNCDILIHEVYYHEGLKTRSEIWQKYHQSVHTSGIELSKIASEVLPKKLVLYHQLFMQEHILDEDMAKNDYIYKSRILNEVSSYFNGEIIYGKDLMIIE
ncbi:MAG: MBL fold metallo-hydrolase [Clostridia bacterium]|nr:MBL fold metallo-hydrolase [Clostridia bacterium]